MKCKGMAAGRHLEGIGKEAGKLARNNNCKERRAPTGITTSNKIWPLQGSWPPQCPWPPAQVNNRQEGRADQLRDLHSPTAQNPTVSLQRTAAVPKVTDHLSPHNRLARLSKHTAFYFPKETVTILPKRATITTHDSLRAELSDFK